MGPAPSSSKRGPMWVAAIPPLGILYTYSIHLSNNLQMGNPVGSGPVPVGGGPVLSRKDSCAEGRRFCDQEGALDLLPINIYCSRLLRAVPTSQAQVQLLYPALPPGGRRAWDQSLQEGQGQGSQVKVARNGASTELMSYPPCPSLNNLSVKLQVVATWSQGPRSQFLF